MPLLSVVMPCFNSSLYIEQAVYSLLTQTFKDWELVIIDDGSTDNTYSIALALALKYEKIEVYRQENKGVSAARNFGYTKSTSSEYVYFFDSDDILLPTFLEELIKKFNESFNIAVVYSDYQEVDKEGNNLKSQYKFKRLIPTRFWLRNLPEWVEETPFVSIYCGSNINESTSIFRKSYFDSAGGWNETFNYAEGMELFLKISLVGKIVYIPKELFVYRRHDLQSQMRISDGIKNKFINKAHNAIKVYCNNNPAGYKKVKLSLVFFNTRVRIKYISSSLKHNLRYNSIRFVKLLIVILNLYVKSFELVFYKKILKQ